ncbi:putative bifunctional diguanylate cyclase/phosphodiesterase [Clostridium sp. B9]|uniref:putative bifunctional diguanylate cyclase/phosphodiesterase n=1 Tax=Clostridium sp. B9 TaxID=3423224 RepID=UPI003D2EAC4D
MQKISKILKKAIVINIIIIILLSVLSYIGSAVILNSIDETVYNSYIDNIVNDLEINLEGLKESAINISQNQDVINILNSNNINEVKNKEIEEEVKIAKSILMVTSFSNNIIIIDSKNSVIFDGKNVYDGYLVEERPWYKNIVNYYKTKSDRNAELTVAHKDFLTGKTCIAIVSDIKYENDIIGFVMVNIYLDELVNYIESSYKNGIVKVYVDLKNGKYYDPKLGVVENLKLEDKDNFIKKEDYFVFEFNIESSLFNKGISTINKINGIITIIMIAIIILLIGYLKKEIFKPILINLENLKKILKQLNKYNFDLEDKKEVEQLEEMVNIFNNVIDESARKFIYYDPLTKLPNRNELNRICDNLIKNREPFSIIFIDINKLKYINDAYGHNIGDKFLVEFSNILSQSIGDRAILIRLSGDEFIILYKDYTSNEDLSGFFEERIVKPFKDKRIVYDKFEVAFSSGVATYPKDGETLYELLKKSDYTMYINKKKLIVNKLSFFENEVYKELERRETIALKLKEGIRNDEFYIFYQPIVDKDKKIKKLEALIRWNNKELGFVSPAEFIEIAEKSRDIINIGYWCIRRVCRDIRRFKEIYSIDNMKLNINVSPIQLTQKDFASKMKSILQEYEIDFNKINIEITESVILDEDKIAFENLDELDKVGVKLSLDDFGTGYTSFSYLKKFNGDSLKIDKKLIDNATDKEYRIVKSIKEIGHELGLKIVVEGVEHKEQFEKLKEIGCDFFQGYYIAKPMSFENLKKIFEEERSKDI